MQYYTFNILSIWHRWDSLSVNRITDYFRNRKQFVQMNDSRSDAFRQICGVPQGFILGPLFFIIHLTICESANELEFMFADDTVFLRRN